MSKTVLQEKWLSPEDLARLLARGVAAEDGGVGVDGFGSYHVGLTFTSNGRVTGARVVLFREPSLSAVLCCDGWYDVVFEPNESPTHVYLRFNPDSGIVWGWDEEDDPERLDLSSATFAKCDSETEACPNQ